VGNCDIVCSFGFIEHFNDYKSIILKHDQLLKENGLLLITVPNFRGWVQKWMHKIVDNENLKRHNLESTKIDRWKCLLEENGYTIKFIGYLGVFNFWCEHQNRNYLQKFSRRLFCFSVPFLSIILKKTNSAYSPYCAVAAIKNNKK
jgi:predicted SAM-dependent methyltransferase